MTDQRKLDYYYHKINQMLWELVIVSITDEPYRFTTMNVFNRKAIPFSQENFINNIIGLSYLEPWMHITFVDRNVSKVTSSIDLEAFISRFSTKPT